MIAWYYHNRNYVFQNDIYMDYMYSFGISCGQLVQALDAIQCYFEVYRLSAGNSMNEMLSLQGDGACLIKLGCDSLNERYCCGWSLGNYISYLFYVLWKELHSWKDQMMVVCHFSAPNWPCLSSIASKVHRKFQPQKNPSIIPIINKGCCDWEHFACV